MICLNARFSTQSMTGVQRVGYELGRRLLALRPDAVALAPHVPRREYALPVSVVSSPVPTGHGWEQTVLRQRARKGDLLVGLGGTGPVGIARQVVMIHDVNYLLGPEGYSRKFRVFYTALQRHLARRATLCTVSHWSARTIGEAFGVDPDRFTVIPNAADHMLEVVREERAPAQLGLAGRRYVLCVGNANPNKNFATALTAYAGLDDPDFDLVIVGGGNAKVFAAEPAMADHPRVHRLPRISDGALRSVIEGADAFLMPSLLEGFGIPALEAMALGVPVIAARAAALPEVCGNAALFAEPRDAGAMARAMTALMGNAELAARMRTAGRERARMYSWDRSAWQLADLAERVIRQA